MKSQNKFYYVIIVCISGLFAGDRLQKIYGLDPPYIYLQIGMGIYLISIITLVITVVLLIISLLKKIKY